MILIADIAESTSKGDLTGVVVGVAVALIVALVALVKWAVSFSIEKLKENEAIKSESAREKFDDLGEKIDKSNELNADLLGEVRTLNQRQAAFESWIKRLEDDHDNTKREVQEVKIGIAKLSKNGE